jgi:hypothetical protein
MSQEPHHQFDLLLEFDADQVSPSLSWKTKPEAMATMGPGAGVLQLARHGQIGLTITGTGTQAPGIGHSPYTGFTVRQCALYAQPKLLRCSAMADHAQYAVPMPFAGTPVALHELKLEFASHEQLQSQILTVRKKWEGQLVSAGIPGRWVLTVVLTVDIARKSLEPAPPRVFQFDIELLIDPGALV